jgi:hypothetical protein
MELVGSRHCQGQIGLGVGDGGELAAKACPRAGVFLHRTGTCFAYRFPMCLGADRELTGQISINELLIAMGELPVEPMVLSPAADDASLLAEPPSLPGL